MKTPTLKSRDGAAVGKVTIEAFRRGSCGRALLLGDAGYDSARRIWNASIDKHPGLIAQSSDAADVVRAVKFSRANKSSRRGQKRRSQCCRAGLCDDGIVIDLSAMNRAAVDPGRRTVRAQAGALLGDVDRETHPHGLAVPTGVVSKPGIAGLTLGGGVGWLVRKYGLTCDNLFSCEIVTAEGEIVTANAEQTRTCSGARAEVEEILV